MRRRLVIACLMALMLIIVAALHADAVGRPSLSPSVVSGVIVDSETGLPVPGAEVRIYSMNGELTASSQADSEGRWVFALGLQDSCAKVIQAGSEGYFVRTKPVGACTGHFVIALVPDTIAGFADFLRLMAVDTADGTRLAVFYPDRSAEICILERNPVTGSSFESWQIDAVRKILGDQALNIGTILGFEPSIRICSEAEAVPEFDSGSIWIMPDRPMPGLGSCTWLYDLEDNVIAAIILLNTSIPTPEMLRHVVLHEILHIILPEDVLVMETMMSEVYMFFDYTRLDMKAARLLSNSNFLEVGTSGGARLARLEEILGMQWGILDMPWLLGASR